MKTLVVLPTYNERMNLEKLVKEIISFLPEVEILVIDDASPDGTGEVADELSTKMRQVSVVHRSKKMGLGSAYLEGFQYALAKDFQAVIQMDADFSHSPGALPVLLKELESHDCVIGSRYVEGGGIQGWSWHRLALSRCANFYCRNILNVPIFDLTGGFRAVRREVLEKLNLRELLSEGYAFQIELNWRIFRKGFRVRETPIIFSERGGGKSKFGFPIILEAFWMVWKLKFFLSSP